MNNQLTIKKSSSIIRLKNSIIKDFKRHKGVYLLAIPMIVFYIIFTYIPMYGVIIAFKDFNPRLGIMGSEWVGFEHFISFFDSYYFGRLLKNTILLNIFDVIWSFPAPIILALLLNEVRNKFFKKTVQTVTYLPHFISLVVVCGIIVDFTASDGLINAVLSWFGIEGQNWLSKPEWFRTIFISSGMWQGIGWGTIIYLAALSGIDPALYEAATIDGANRWKKVLHITIPSIAPTVIIMLILRIGSMMSVGTEKVILLYNPLIYETADVISSFVYRKGLLEFDYSYSTAVSVFNSVINFILLVITNKLSKKYSETSLW